MKNSVHVWLLWSIQVLSRVFVLSVLGVWFKSSSLRCFV